MRVAVDVHPPRGDAVEDPAAVVRVEIHAFALDDRKRRRRRLHLRVRMPHAGAITLNERSRGLHRRYSIRRFSGSRAPAAAANASGVNGSRIGSWPITLMWP